MDKITLMNQLLSDAHVLYVKLHNYHWNVKGLHFFVIHEKTEALYQHMSVLYDDLAERIIQLGGKPIVTINQILQTSKIKEDDGVSFDVSYVIKSIATDFDYLLKSFVNLSEIAGDDNTTSDYADEQAAFLEKEIWMLNQSLS